MNKFILICLGSAAGGGARYLLSGWVLALLGTSFPYGTLTVNIIGSFLIGIIMHLGLTTEMMSPMTRVVLTTGVLGGFTTYSSFNYETVQYLQEGEIIRGVLNILIMVFSCLAAGFMGLILAKRFLGT
ncbi:MAG: CrcB protein [uncultured bacterium]|nr:MAG: CrcB protein [uncultured bacterium]